MSRERLVALGVVARPHGVRGELRVHLYNPESDLLLGRSRVMLSHRGETREREILEARRHGEALLVTLEGVASREAADALRGAELAVPRDELPPLGEGEHYHVDLIGLEARD